jgi:hypothetical protein
MCLEISHQGVLMSEDTATPRLVPTKPEAEIAAELKQRFEQAIAPAMAIMDEAVTHGLLVQFDAIAATPPFFRHKPINLRIAKHF